MAAGNASDGRVGDCDAFGVALEEFAAHSIVDVALAIYRECGRFRRIETVCATDESPGFGVDQRIVIHEIPPIHVIIIGESRSGWPATLQKVPEVENGRLVEGIRSSPSSIPANR